MWTFSILTTTRCQYMNLPEGRSATWSANMSSNSRNVKLLFLTTRCQYWGVDLPLDLPIWALTLEMWNCHSWPLDATTGGSRSSRSATWSANMSSNTVEMWIKAIDQSDAYLSLDLSQIETFSLWALSHYWEIAILWTTRCQLLGGRSTTWSGAILYSSMEQNKCKLPILDHRCLPQNRVSHALSYLYK